jgi:hypothetical protein
MNTLEISLHKTLDKTNGPKFSHSRWVFNFRYKFYKSSINRCIKFAWIFKIENYLAYRFPSVGQYF